ncbi:restriction endonuclease subunit S [Marinobacterium mangrovicola]|uniref:Type I restriction enzyme S subunit n=1 Tax=Marinobacterium mangrovicola TaxID=1476959 RepID=A0A4R1GPA7_9GAMM|nr:restriction endonuclease subunit S [Marinobacterium mangrovicola]TCK09130.1 type I restriction enzyme S subunit [Marinobacterium mangrovicola]
MKIDTSSSNNRYQSYSDYKDSGIGWLGKMPIHWQLVRSRYIFTRKQRPVRKNDGVVTAFRDGQVTLRVNRRVDGFTESIKEIGYQGVRKGDLLIHAMDGFAGAIGVSDSDGKCSPVCSVCVARIKIHMPYYGYLVRQLAVTDFITSLAKGIRERSTEFRYSEFSNLELAVPTISEQEKIAEFLDHETAKIDTLIEKQQQLIKLLKEKRQAVISHAVTKGLNPDAPMKDSGVEWLGEVPEHWTVRRLKHTATLQSGIPKGKDLSDKVAIEVPMLRVANVQDGYLKLDDVHNLKIEPSDLDRYLLKTGDVLMNEGGDNDKLGRGAIWRGEISPCIHQNHVFAIRPRDIEPEWLTINTRSEYAKFYFYTVAKQSTNLASISSSNIKETPLVIPPKDERIAILDHLREQLDKLDRVQEFSVKQIELLQERRTALISAAVTGKIDVRNFKVGDTDAA